MDLTRTQENNAQTLWADFKVRMIARARERAKVVIPKIEKDIANLNAKLETISNDPLVENEECSLSITVIKEAISGLESRRRESNRAIAKARNTVQGETLSRYWSGLNKEKKPKEIIHRLKKSEPPPPTNNRGIVPTAEYETHSQRMAEMMKNHHENLQNNEVPIDEIQREATIGKILGNIHIVIKYAAPIIFLFS
ncbi:hypothetical protein F5051DRAFT_444122 [Lentinula edodes]|nr:hypothetical protein F5051DRAFT_444122 [Lentinula edodes]